MTVINCDYICLIFNLNFIATMRIIHLTDFHLTPKNLKDWNEYVREPLLEKLSWLHKNKEIDFIAFTGDLLDRGGKDYKDAAEAFGIFKKEVILPIVERIGLPITKFIIIPGNHDVVRSLDEEWEEIGSKTYFLHRENISKYVTKAIKDHNFNGMKRIEPYKKFEAALYGDADSAVSLSIFGSSFKYSINGISVGVCALNSSWRCYSNDDSGNLLIGEDQLIANTYFVKDCEIKVALVHHPLDGLSAVERSTITNHIYKEFDILLTGHTHDTVTSVATGFTGSVFVNVAPSGINEIRSDSRTFANGFTVIDFDKKKSSIDCIYWRYNHDKKSFVLNTDASIEINGTSHYEIPDKQTSKKTSLLNTLLDNIKEDHFPEMNEHSIGSRVLTGSGCIKEAFIMPPIDQGSAGTEDDQINDAFNITQIVQYKHNLMFFGSPESGKTVLLYRLIREYVDEFEFLRKIPVYIDFEEIRNKEFITLIKEYLRCGGDDVKELIKDNQIVILIDNLQYNKNGSNKEQINRLHRFEMENQEIQIIAAAEHDIIGILPSDYVELSRIPFLNFFIRNLRSQEIKSLMKVWLPEQDDLKENERLDKMVSTFNSYSLPSTAMSVSLFLWCTENSERKPINNAVLMEIYIEIILEKLNKENIYRGTFDFTNKIQLLAKIAHEMLLVNEFSYSVIYSKFVNIIEEYLISVGFNHDPKVIIDYLLERKLFIKFQGNRIKFTYSCFFHFFIGKRMEYSPDFRDYVLDESRYFEFYKEIDYYTGLVRSDKTTFKLILSRFEDAFKPTDDVLNKVPDIDSYFTPKPKVELSEEKAADQEPIIRNIELDQVVAKRPSDHMLDNYYNRRLSQIANPSIIVQKNQKLTLERVLIIMANTLRNSEGVEDIKLKRQAYNSLIKYNLTFMILYKESLIQYIIKNQRLPADNELEVQNPKFELRDKALSLYNRISSFELSFKKQSDEVSTVISTDNKGLYVDDSFLSFNFNNNIFTLLIDYSHVEFHPFLLQYTESNLGFQDLIGRDLLIKSNFTEADLNISELTLKCEAGTQNEYNFSTHDFHKIMVNHVKMYMHKITNSDLYKY